MPFLRRYVSLAIGLASGAKASLLITQWIVRYSEYFLREQEGTSLAIAAEAVQGAPVRLGGRYVWLGLDHDDQILATTIDHPQHAAFNTRTSPAG
jgi:hypothetical protein